MNRFEMDTNKKFGLIRGLNPVPLKKRHSLSLLNVKIGSYLVVEGNIFKVEDKYTYKNKSESWDEFKLVNVMTLETRFMEIEEDDDIIVYLTQKEVKMRDLPDTDDIEDMSERESGEIRLNGKTFYYDDDYKAKFSRDGSDKEMKVYFYDFEADDGTLLTVEEWEVNKEEYEYEAWLSKEYPALYIEILQI